MLISKVMICSELGSPVITATGVYRGQKVSAKATCHENDKWDWDTGVSLAMARLAKKVDEMELARIAERRDEVLDAIADLEDELEELGDLEDETSDALDDVLDTIDEIIETTHYK